MAKITFDKGDVIRFSDGFGIILSEHEALLIKGKGGRTGRTIEKGEIPPDALPNSELMDFEVSFALQAAIVAIS